MAESSPRHEAFTRYVLPEMEVLYRVAHTLTGQRADAEDLVQDTLVRAFRSIERFDGQYPRAWLLTIMRNAERNRHRRQRPQLLDDPNQNLEQREVTQASANSPENVVIDSAFETEVERAFRDLPERYRAIIGLIDIEDLSYAEAAELLGVPVGTVMSRLHRGRKRIRKQLDSAGVIVNRGRT